MKTASFIKSAIYLFTFITIASCSKDNGEQGPQGEQGIQGEQGPQGEQGEPGTVNILYSEWMDQDWNLTNNTTLKIMEVDAENVTVSFLENGGIVLGFFRYQEHLPFPLPHLTSTANTIRTFYTVHSADEGNVRFSIESTDGTTLTDEEVNGPPVAGINAQYKYVLIPGGTPISASKKSSTAWEELSYKEVCEALNIPE